MSFSIAQFGMRLPLLTVNTIALHGEIPKEAHYPLAYEHMKLLFAKLNRRVSTVDADSSDGQRPVRKISSSGGGACP